MFDRTVSRVVGGLVAIVVMGTALAGARAEDTPIEPVSSELALLERYFGMWNVEVTHFDSRGEQIGSVKGQEDNTWILDEHALQRKYATGKEPDVYEALGVLTHSQVDAKYHGVWFDNASTSGKTTVTGEWNAETQTFVYLMESVGPTGSAVNYRVIEKFPDENTRVATTYLIEGDRVTKRMETRYTRRKPCPGNMRRFGGYNTL